MLTVQFQNEEDLSNFVMLTWTYNYSINYSNLMIQGDLPEAALELACQAFHAVVTGPDRGAFPFVQNKRVQFFNAQALFMYCDQGVLFTIIPGNPKCAVVFL